MTRTELLNFIAEYLEDEVNNNFYHPTQKFETEWEEIVAYSTQYHELLEHSLSQLILRIKNHLNLQ